MNQKVSRVLDFLTVEPLRIRSILRLVLIALIAWWLYGQTLDAAALLGIGLILAGVVVIQLFSKAH